MDDAGSRNRPVRTGVRAAALVSVLLSAWACGAPGGEPATGPVWAESDALRTVPLPPPEGMSESVAEQLQERHAAVERERNRAPRRDRQYAEAYGELGKVLLGAN